MLNFNSSQIALRKSLGQDIETTFHSWTAQAGFPLVTVELEEVSEYKRRITLCQKPMVTFGSKVSQEKLWHIPILVTPKNPNKKPPIAKFLLTEKSQTFEVKCSFLIFFKIILINVTCFQLYGVSQADWVHLNPDLIGYYKVKYSPKTSPKIQREVTQAFPKEILSAESRASIVWEHRSLALSGDGTVYQLIKCIERFGNEPSLVVWEAIFEAMKLIRLVTLGAKCPEKKVRGFNVKLMKSKARQIGTHSSRDPGLVLANIFRATFSYKCEQICGNKTYCDE